MARTEEYTPQQIIDAIEACGGLVIRAAKRLKCTPKTVRNYAARYPAVKAAIEAARDDLLDKAEDALLTRINKGDTAAIIFTLKTVGKVRGYVERQELTGANGEPLAAPTVYLPSVSHDNLEAD